MQPCLLLAGREARVRERRPRQRLQSSNRSPSILETTATDI